MPKAKSKTSTKSRRSKATKSALISVSFVKPRSPTGLNFWAAKASGDYKADCEKGSELAFEYLGFLQKHAFPLQWIVDDMGGRKIDGLEVGFLAIVTRAAGLGARVLLDIDGGFERLAARKVVRS